MSLFDKWTHVFVEESYEQVLNVTTIIISIGHDDNLSILDVFYLKIIIATSTDCIDDGI